MSAQRGRLTRPFATFYTYDPLDNLMAPPDLLNLGYGYATGNNGQVQTITDNLDATRSMTYSYDAWARLQYATAGPVATPTWKLGMVYDRYGNRTNQNLLAGTGPSSLTTYNAATNRISDAGFVYDAAGNLTNDSFHTYAFDAENRMKQVDGGSLNNGTDYRHDGNGLRVKKVVGTAATTTLYIFSGTKAIAEYAGGAAAGSPTREYVYSGAQLLATIEDATTKYHHPDHLSTRVESDGTTGAITRTSGHFPFGETWYETGTTGKWQFTSYERDPESGLDYAIFRSHSSRLGRFMTPDLLAGDAAAPQSLNRYGYAGNDAVNRIDPLGLCDLWNAATNTCVGAAPVVDVTPVDVIMAAAAAFNPEWFDPARDPADPPGNTERDLSDLPNLTGEMLNQWVRSMCQVFAILDTIAWAEGTATDADGGYGRVVRGRVVKSPYDPSLVGKSDVSITDFSRHPRILVEVQPGLYSTAAGRYQFTYSTWTGLGLPNFGPADQDRGAFMLLQRRGSIEPLLQGDLAQAVANANREWASLPGSPYGQPTRTMQQLNRVYQKALADCQGR